MADLGRLALRLAGGALLVAALIVGGLAIRTFAVGHADQREPADAIVVLGAAQYNGEPSPVFQARLDHAAALFRDGVADRVLTVGAGLPGDATTEAAAGREALIVAGIPADRVTAVPVGNDTLVSLRAAAQVLHADGQSSVVLVTDPWHSHRAQVMARDLDLQAQVSPVQTGPSTRSNVVLPYVLRETAGTLYYLVVGGPSGAGSPVL